MHTYDLIDDTIRDIEVMSSSDPEDSSDNEPIRSTITVKVEDAGYFSKTFSFPPSTKLRLVIEKYKSYLCTACSRPELLDFWFEATKVNDIRLLLAIPCHN